MNFYFSAYGLRLSANRLISGLRPCPYNPQVDVRVYLDGLSSWPGDALRLPRRIFYESPYRDEQGRPVLTAWKLGDAYFRLAYPDGTEFLIDPSGSEIWTAQPDPSTLADTISYLVHPVMGLVLRLRGVTCLHASAVACDDRAIVFLGASEAGKSTTAAAFAYMGLPVLSDEIVTLADCDGGFWANPACTNLRLWPESIHALRAANCFSPELAPNLNGRRYYLDLTRNGYRFQEHPLPLGAIYLLDERYDRAGAPCMEPIEGMDRLMSLLANTYGSSLPREMTQRQDLAVLGQVAATVPLRRVHAHTDPIYLPKLCELIAEDARNSAAVSEPAIPLPA